MSKARITVTRQGERYIAQVYNELGAPDHLGEFHEASYAAALSLAKSQAAHRGIRVDDKIANKIEADRAAAADAAKAERQALEQTRSSEGGLVTRRRTRRTKQAETNAPVGRVPWQEMVDRAVEPGADGEPIHIASRKYVGAMMTQFQTANTGEAGDRVVAYRQKDHWAFLSLFGVHEGRIDVALRLVRQLADRIAQLESEAEKRAGIAYRGVHRPGEEYGAGDIVTHAGSAWHCNGATADRPGDGGPGWTLMVKAGRDAKESAR